MFDVIKKGLKFEVLKCLLEKQDFYGYLHMACYVDMTVRKVTEGRRRFNGQ